MKGPCRNRGRLPKLTAYEKKLNLIFCNLINNMQIQCHNTLYKQIFNQSNNYVRFEFSFYKFTDLCNSET